MSDIDTLLDVEIGKGGYGKVYTVKGMSNIVVKKSNKGSTCRVWSDEYKKIKNLIKNIKSSTYSDIYSKLKMVRIIEPEKFTEDEYQNCYMTMKRIFRPEGSHLIAPTLQSILGENDLNNVYEGRGQFIGISQIKKYVSDKNLRLSVYELGIVMGLIHFVGKNDAYDLEVFLGKEHNSKISRFYIADFDLSENIEKYDDNTIERIIWSLNAIEYFPKNNNKIFLDLFIRGYSFIAVMAGVSDDILMKIIKEYVK